MATVVKNPSYGEALGEALGGLGGTLLGQQYGMGLARQQEEEQFQNRQTKLNQYLQSTEFQNRPLEEKLTMLNYVFGKDTAAAYGKAKELEISEKKIDKESKPPLTLNEELNQANKRYGERVKNIIRPFEKQDAFGNIYLDFEEQEQQRSNVLGKLDRELKKYTKQIEDSYTRYGQPPPGDIEETLKSEIIVDYQGKKLPYTVVENIMKFTSDFPPSKYKGKTATDEETGIKFRSDGTKWEIIE